MKKIFPIVFSLLVCLSFVLSLVDGEELPVKSDFNHDNIYSHIENICADGTHSIVHDEENKKSIIRSYIECGIGWLGK